MGNQYTTGNYSRVLKGEQMNISVGVLDARPTARALLVGDLSNPSRLYSHLRHGVRVSLMNGFSSLNRE